MQALFLNYFMHLDNRDLRGKISNKFSQLESLKGIFLGKYLFKFKISSLVFKSNSSTSPGKGKKKLSGSIPSSLSELMELQSLWLGKIHFLMLCYFINVSMKLSIYFIWLKKIIVLQAPYSQRSITWKNWKNLVYVSHWYFFHVLY